MAVTRTLASSSEEFFQQIDHITKSHSLRGSESLCKLLLYLAKQALDNPEAPLKEYQIATEVYGRSADFDPQSDSTIRVQAGRLRMKLAEYYASEGANDPIVVKIPKGSYHLVFEAKQFEPHPQLVSPAPEAVAASHVEVVPTRWKTTVFVLSALLAISLALLGSQLWNRNHSDPVSTSVPGGQPASGPLAEFWRPFISAAEEPWVIFSNAAFVGRPETGMRYYKSAEDAKTPVYDHYTGVGEVLAVHALDDAFSSLGQKIRVKRGSLFSLDDARNTNLIFVGSPSENLSLHDIPGTTEFVFERVPSGARKGDLSIVDRHPKTGDAPTYLASPSSAELTEDYAVVGLVPGVTPDRFVMILAGTTTFGTQGAVEFVSRADSVERLLRQMPVSGDGLKPFEALVRVKIARGVPLDTELVSLRTR